MSNPSSQQALAVVRVCQMLSNSYRPHQSFLEATSRKAAGAIYLFRYDTTRQVVYIQAGTEARNDEIEIEIPDNGLWRFLDD